jgi:hypothetical protein
MPGTDLIAPDNLSVRILGISGDQKGVRPLQMPLVPQFPLENQMEHPTRDWKKG